jgi:hypothetical protein
MMNSGVSASGKLTKGFAGNGVSATEGKNGRLLCFSNGEGE